MKKRLKAAAKRWIALTCAIVLCSAGTVSYADEVDNLRQETAGLQTQLNQLNKELNLLSSEITNLATQIEESSAAIEKAELDLVAAELNEDMQYESMKKRIKFLYETGNPSFLHMLCAAEDMADFLNRTEFIKNVTEYDRQMLAELTDIREGIEEKELALQAEQEELLAMKDELATQQKKLEAKIASTSSELQASSDALAKANAAQQAANNANNSTTTTSPSPNVSNSDLVLFAAILQCEAGSTNYDGLLAVATVIMNRVESSKYPNSLYGVIYQKGQFSPTWNGSLSRVLAKGPASLCYQVAQEALNGARHSSILGCYSFRAAWTGHYGTVIGGNVFF